MSPGRRKRERSQAEGTVGVKARGGRELGTLEDWKGWSECDWEAAAAPEFSPVTAPQGSPQQPADTE